MVAMCWGGVAGYGAHVLDGVISSWLWYPCVGVISSWLWYPCVGVISSWLWCPCVR